MPSDFERSARRRDTSDSASSGERRGTRAETFDDVDAYVRHLAQTLPDPYLHSRDMRQYVETLRDVIAGRTTPEQAMKKMPNLKRVGGVCPCSKSVRWVVEEPEPAREPAA